MLAYTDPLHPLPSRMRQGPGEARRTRRLHRRGDHHGWRLEKLPRPWMRPGRCGVLPYIELVCVATEDSRSRGLGRSAPGPPTHAAGVPRTGKQDSRSGVPRQREEGLPARLSADLALDCRRAHGTRDSCGHGSRGHAGFPAKLGGAGRWRAGRRRRHEGCRRVVRKMGTTTTTAERAGRPAAARRSGGGKGRQRRRF